MSAPATAPPSGRMTLANISTGPIDRPRRILLYGVEGVGKSTFAASADAPIFLCGEEGSDHLDVPRFPAPRTWLEAREAVDVLRAQATPYRHLVVDTLDWLEPLVWQHVCARAGKESIEDFGYGKGYLAALDEWRLFVKQLEQLRAERQMGVILLAHSHIKPFKNPEADDFDRYEMKLHAKAGGFLREWCDAVLFANYQTFAHKDEKKRVRGVATGERVLYTQRTAAYDAKNRYNLPPTLPLAWDAFTAAVAAGRPGDPAVTRATIEARLAAAPAELAAKVRAAVATHSTDAAFLTRILITLEARLEALAKETPA